MKHSAVTPLKLIISGPVGAGKTTFVSTLSEDPVVNSDEQTTEEIGKTHTTVALDFGRFVLQGRPLHLFGTPGQSRFDFMWEILSEGALGLLLLVAGDRPADFPQALSILRFITSRNPMPFIIAVTRQDSKGAWGPEKIAGYFAVPTTRVIGIDARNAQSSLGAVTCLLSLIEGSTSGNSRNPFHSTSHSTSNSNVKEST
ncbi:MAG: ATP/GTP-binding protein [Rhodanobacter sp.]|jgi:signal recognition particle receptor subunit beta|nr:ATP/GTP-binding protein [Rhodanobacter sp.]